MAIIVGPPANVSGGGTGTKVGTAQTRAVYGVSIPISAGERAFDGHVIWASGTYQTQTIESFPSEIINGVPTIYGAVAHDKLCMDFAVSLGYHLIPEAERGNVGVYRIWADDQLVFDATLPTLRPLDFSFVFYDGRADQTADPTIFAKDAERATSFRNMLYIVFKGFVLADGGAYSANTVASGSGVNPWRPTTSSPLGTIPNIRVELIDGLTVTSGTTDFTMLAASTIWENGTIWDWDRGLAYAWSAMNTAAANMHTFDIEAQVELSSVPVVGSYTNLLGVDTVHLYDKNNQVAIFAKNGIPNTAPIVTVDLQTADIVGTFGTNSTLLHPGNSGDNSTLSSGGVIDRIPYPITGDIAYLLDGQVERSVAVFGSLKWDVSLLPIGDGGTLPTDLGLPEVALEKGGAAIKLPDSEDIHFITCYPFLQFGDQVSGAQDGLAIVGAGTKLYGIQFGFRMFAGVSRCKVLGFGLIKDFSGDLPGYSPVLGVVNPLDRGIIIFLSDGLGGWKSIKYQPAVYDYFPITGGDWGTTSALSDWKGRWPNVDRITSIPSYKTWEVIPPALNTTAGYNNALRQGNLSGGTFGWNSGSNSYLMQLSTGRVDTVATGVSGIDDFVWDSRINAIYFPHGTGHTRPLGIFQVGAATSAASPISDFLRWILLYVGFTTDQIQIDAALTDPCSGMLIDHPRDLSTLMRDLGQMYDFQFFESEGLAKCIRTVKSTASADGAAAFDLTVSDLCPVQENQVTSGDNFVTVLAQPSQQVSAVSVQYSDLDQSFSWAVQTFGIDQQSSGSVASGKMVLDLPVVMHRAEAFRRATKIQAKESASSDTHYFRLSQRYMQLEPSDLVTITKPPFRYGVRIDEATFNGDWSMSFSGASYLFQDDIAITDEATDGTPDTGGGFGNHDAKPLALDMPLLYAAWAGNSGTFVIAAGVESYDQTSFAGATLVYGLAPGAGNNVGLVTVDSKYGLIVGTVPDTTTPFQTDNTTTLRIALRSGTVDGQWASTDASGLLCGLNTIVVGAAGRWEVIYFRDVTKITNKVVEISGLLRGRRGTEVQCGTHAANDTVILAQSVATGFQPGLRPQVLDTTTYFLQTLMFDARGTPQTRPRMPINVQAGAFSEYPWAPSDIHAVLGSRFNVVGSPSYSNPGGTGDRTALITVTGNYVVQSAGSTPSNLVDGGNGNNTTDSIDFQAGQTAVVINFNFSALGLPQIITEYKWTQNTAVSIGTYAFEGSLDNVSWDTLDAGTDLGGSSSITTVTFVNSTSYMYYRLRQTSGSTSSSPWCREIEFKTQSDIGANDLLFTWLRRDRISTGLFVEDDVLLSTPDSAAYRFEALISGTRVHFHNNITPETYLFTAADQTTAGFSPPLAEIDVKVYQQSTLVGFGFARTTTIDVE